MLTILASEELLSFVRPRRTCARKTLSKSLRFRFCALTLIYLGGGGKVGINPMGWLNISASMPEGRLSDISDSLSFKSNISSRGFFPPMIRLKNETPFLWKLSALYTLGEGKTPPMVDPSHDQRRSM